MKGNILFADSKDIKRSIIMERKTMGAFIAVLRKSSGMTQKELAEKLGVSDKTISHWERDESAPDISVIPVIAEIFGVTCDELLRGEKASETAPTVTATVKGEKQVKYLLEKSFGKLKMRQIICAGITLVGIIIGKVTAEILRHFIFAPYAPFMIACAFFAVALILGLVFHMSFISSVKNDDFDENLIESFKLRANSITSKAVFWIVVAVTFSFTFSDARFESFDGLTAALFYAAIALAVCIIISVFMKFTGILPNKKRSKAEKKMLRLRIAVLAVTAGFIIAGIGTQIYFNDVYSEPEAIIFMNAHEFKEFMETPKEKPDYAYVLSAIASVSMTAMDSTAKEETIINEETNTADDSQEPEQTEIYYPNGEIAVSFKWLNNSVSYYKESADVVFPIEVYTYEAIYNSRQLGPIGDRIVMAAYVYYPLVVIIATAVYLSITKRSKHNSL